MTCYPVAYKVTCMISFEFILNQPDTPDTFGHCDSNLTLKVLVTTIDAQWEGMGDVGLVRYEPALLLPCPTTRVLSYSN